DALAPAVKLPYEAKALSQPHTEEKRVDENCVPQPGSPLHDRGEVIEVGIQPLGRPNGNDASRNQVTQRHQWIGDESLAVAHEHVPHCHAAPPPEAAPALERNAQYPPGFLTDRRPEGRGKVLTDSDVFACVA